MPARARAVSRDLLRDLALRKRHRGHVEQTQVARGVAKKVRGRRCRSANEFELLESGAIGDGLRERGNESVGGRGGVEQHRDDGAVVAAPLRDLQRQIERSRDDRRPVADLVDRSAKVSGPRECAVVGGRRRRRRRPDRVRQYLSHQTHGRAMSRRLPRERHGRGVRRLGSRRRARCCSALSPRADSSRRAPSQSCVVIQSSSLRGDRDQRHGDQRQEGREGPTSSRTADAESPSPRSRRWRRSAGPDTLRLARGATGSR